MACYKDGLGYGPIKQQYSNPGYSKNQCKISFNIGISDDYIVQKNHFPHFFVSDVLNFIQIEINPNKTYNGH